MARNFAPVRISMSQTVPRQIHSVRLGRNSWGRKPRRRLELELDYRHRILAGPKNPVVRGIGVMEQNPSPPKRRFMFSAHVWEAVAPILMLLAAAALLVALQALGGFER